MSEAQLPPHLAGLRSPDAYSHPTGEIGLIQTHISFLLFAGDFVYKVKKPLDLGFLNFTTLELRRHFCEEEVRLNRRLCADTYLGVVPIVVRAEGVRVDGDGEAVEYAVRMRRLPEQGMMTPLLERDGVSAAMVRAVAERMAAFHANSERSEAIDALGGLDTAMANWRENFEQTESFIGRTISQEQFDDVRAFIERVGDEDGELFHARVREGRARDGHGDLRADAVCFKDTGVCIFDCIEFNERFRYSDVAADIAFLAMDLEDRGRGDLSDELMGGYLAASLDSTLPLLLPFYKCYRAYVRGKVDGFQLDQPEVDAAQKERATESAQRSFALAHRYATQTQTPALIITVGASGSGKSYLANALAAHLGAAIFSSDVVRKQLLGIDPMERRVEPLDSGIYDPESTERTYEALLAEARRWLERGKPVVLDASYLQRASRQAAQRLAGEMGVRFLALACEADESLVRERLSQREGEERSASDGRWEIYEAQQKRREAIDELPKASRLAVDTARPLTQQIASAVERLDAIEM